MHHDPKYGSLRAHQAQALVLAKSVYNEVFPRKVIQAHVAPGGGKTRMAAIFAHELLAAGHVERVLWVVPRDNLRTQVRRDFHDPASGLNRELTTARGGKWPRASQQVLTSLDVAAGVVTTYQTLAADAQRAERWVSQLRTLVILDEGHHLPVDNVADLESGEGAWTDQVRRIVDAATVVLDMSGTPERADEKRIAFVDYEEGLPQFDIRYTRREALMEQAVLPIEFMRLDGFAQWQHLSREHEVELSEASNKQAPKALRSAFGDGSEYRETALRKALAHFTDYRRNAYASRAIVVAGTQKSARYYADFIRSEFSYDVALAISDEKHSARNILRFREHPETFHVLVTVGMAHEGLDVPDCSHLICLTRIRSKPWLEQAFARVTRFNRKCGLAWEDQMAHICVPDDKRMLSIIEELNAEQLHAIDERERGKRAPQPRGPSSFVAGQSVQTVQRISYEDRHLDSADTLRLEKLSSEYKETAGWPTPKRLDLARRLYPNADAAE